MITPQHTQQSPRQSAPGVEFSAPLDSRPHHPAYPGYLDHTAIVDHDSNVLGCIDQLEKNAQLIRLDGGLHWATFGLLDARTV